MSYNAGRTPHEPRGGAQRPGGERLAAGGAVHEFEAFARVGEQHRVFAHHVAAADGVHADLPGGARADQALAAVAGAPSA